MLVDPVTKGLERSSAVGSAADIKFCRGVKEERRSFRDSAGR